ncbi:MAG: hydrogenase expression/formation protein [Gammaproteobacteria bacterium]|nr:hydrogenase expression/formation protein [Gammaproteobacteria bacterium]MDH4255662.1 hydrogenase expression/formation protein [Gammaproteobacteria bacterium]
MKLEQIPVRVTGRPSELTDAILMEIAELLERLVDEGINGAIDLRSLPMSDEDRACLEERLGFGEVSATLDVAGPTEILETAYTGVWWIRHLDGKGRVTAEQIAVTRVPDILISPPEDMRNAAARLIAEMKPAAAKRNEEEAPHV